MGLRRFIMKGVTAKRIINVFLFYIEKNATIPLFNILNKRKWYLNCINWSLSKISKTKTIKLLDIDSINYFMQMLHFNNIEVSYTKPTYYDELNSNKNPIDNIIITNQIFYFKNAVVSNDSNLIILNKENAYYQLSNYVDINRIEISSDSLILYHLNKKVLYKSRKNKKSIKSAIWLGGSLSWNYYHLMFEFLVKFKYIENIPKDIPILIDEVCIHVSQFKELFLYLNYQKRDIVTIDMNESYFVNNLYFITSPNIIPPEFININQIQAKDVLLNKDSLIWIRNTLFKHKSKTKFPKRFYLSRKNASNRRKFNEDEIYECIRKYDFECISPENYSIADQISLFSEAEIIVGGAGAAFTNLLFCNSNCKAIIMYKNKLDFSGFSTIAAFMNIELVYVLEDYTYNLEQKSIHESFNINTNEIENLINKWIS